MPPITLDKFMTTARTGGNAWVSEPGFKSLYIRKTERFIESQLVYVIDLANMKASKPGTGAFKALAARLRTDYPGFALFVENEMTPRFCDGLLRLGFKQERHGPLLPCFYMMASS